MSDRTERLETILRAMPPPASLSLQDVLSFWGEAEAAERVRQLAAHSENQQFRAFGAALAAPLVELMVGFGEEFAFGAADVTDAQLGKLIQTRANTAAFTSALRQAHINQGRFKEVALPLIRVALTERLYVEPVLSPGPVDGLTPLPAGGPSPLMAGGIMVALMLAATSVVLFHQPSQMRHMPAAPPVSAPQASIPQNPYAPPTQQAGAGQGLSPVMPQALEPLPGAHKNTLFTPPASAPAAAPQG